MFSILKIITGETDKSVQCFWFNTLKTQYLLQINEFSTRDTGENNALV